MCALIDVCARVCVCVLKRRHGWAYGEHRNLGIRTRHWACVCGSRACRTDKGWDLTRHCQSKKRAGHSQDSCTRWSTICIGGINGSSDPARWYKERSRLPSPACKERHVHPLTPGLPAASLCVLKSMHLKPLLMIHLVCMFRRSWAHFFYLFSHSFFHYCCSYLGPIVSPIRAVGLQSLHCSKQEMDEEGKVKEITILPISVLFSSSLSWHP